MKGSAIMEAARSDDTGVAPGGTGEESETLLPAGFEDLERFKGWILHTEAERNLKRLKSDYADIKAFYDGMLARQQGWLAHLDRFTVDSLPPAEGRLYAMTLSLMEVAPAVEYFQSPDLADAVPYDRMAIHEPGYTAKG